MVGEVAELQLARSEAGDAACFGGNPYLLAQQEHLRDVVARQRRGRGGGEMLEAVGLRMVDVKSAKGAHEKGSVGQECQTGGRIVRQAGGVGGVGVVVELVTVDVVAVEAIDGRRPDEVLLTQEIGHVGGVQLGVAGHDVLTLQAVSPGHQLVETAIDSRPHGAVALHVAHPDDRSVARLIGIGQWFLRVTLRIE